MEFHIGFYCTVDIEGENIKDIKKQFENIDLVSSKGLIMFSEIHEITEVTRIDDMSNQDYLEEYNECDE